MITDNFAVLRDTEEPDEYTTHGVLYSYKYDEHDVFFIYTKGAWIEQPSTAFDFMPVGE